MADYELGTAHGRIVVDYDDKGIGQAEKSFDRIKTRTKELLSQFGEMASKWRSYATDIGSRARKLEDDFGAAAKGVAVLAVATAAFTGPVNNLVPGIKVLKDLKEAFGGLPDGAERFPTLIQRIIRLSAAVSLFHGATGLLARATRNIAGVSLLTRGLASFGSVVNRLASPIHYVSGAVTGFLTILKGLETVKKYAKYFELFHVASTGLAGGLNIVLPLAAKLAVDIKNLLGVVALAPAALGIFALALGTLKVATTGFGDALKAIVKGDAAKFNEAIKDMAPAAQETARAFRDLYEKAWKPLQKAVQQKFFEGLAPILTQLAGRLLPSVERSMIAVAGSFNRAIKEAQQFFNTDDFAKDFGDGLDYSSKAVDNLVKAIEPLLQVFYNLWRVGVEVLADLTKNAGTAAAEFAAFVDTARRTGQLEAWMRRGIKAVQDFIAIVVNFGKIFKTIFQGLGISGGDGFLAWLRQATEAFNNFLKSAEGQQILKAIGDWMRDGAAHAKELADVFIKDVLPAIQAFLPFIKAMGDAVNAGLVAGIKVLAPLFQALGEVLSALAPALAPIVTVIVFLGTLLVGLGLALKIASGAWAVFRTAILALKGIQGIVTLLGRLPGIVGGIFRALGPLVKLLRGGLIAAALAEIARGIDKMNVAAAGGDPEKLDDMGQSLHDLLAVWDGFWNSVTTGDFSWFSEQFADIGTEWDTLVKKFQTGESPIGAFAKKVGDSFQNDLIRPMEEFGTKVKDAITAGIDALKGFGEGANGVIDDVVGFFRDLPTHIMTYLSGLGAQISTAASTLWNGFLNTIKGQFQPVIDFFSQSPYEIGFAIGAGIGDLIRVGGELITNLKNGAIQKWVDFTNWLSTLLPNMISSFSNWGAALFAQAQAAWEQFKQAVFGKVEETRSEVEQIPQKTGDAIANLGSTIVQKANEAWTSFKNAVTQKANEAIAFIRTFPGQAGAAIASFASIMLQKANEALASFRQGVTNGWNTAAAFIRDIPNKIRSAIGNLGSLLVSAGRAVIDGLLSGIRAGVQAMYDFVSGIAAGIAARKGPLPYDKKLLIPAGVAIIGGLIRGMKETMPQLWRQINGVNGALGTVGGVSSGLNLSGNAATSSVAGGVTAPAYRGRAVGGDGAAAAGDIYNMGGVTIPAKDIAEFKSVTDFFDAVQQKARAGRAGR